VTGVQTCALPISSQPEADTDIKELSVLIRIESLDKSVLHMKIVDAKEACWEVPLFNPNSRRTYACELMNSMGIEYTTNPFEFKLTDPSTNQQVVSTYKLDSLRLLDKYLK
jgi:hypothetical protein